MKVIWFNGNLGNQVFYCKYKDYLQKKYPQEKIYAYIDPNCPKVRVHELFDLELPAQNKWINFLSFFIFKIVGVIFRRMPKFLVPRWYCHKGILNENATFFEHSLQDKSYYEEENSNWLNIRQPDCLSEDYMAFEKKIKDCNSVAVHVRRGDYVHKGSAYVDLSATDYYEKAMAKAQELYNDCQFFFFSDDLDYIKSKYQGANIHYVDCNRGADSYLDIKLMTLAKVNVMANSTFSYWGAYMNNENKVVIYPNSWFCKETLRIMPNIMLNNWIKMD